MVLARFDSLDSAHIACSHDPGAYKRLFSNKCLHACIWQSAGAPYNAIGWQDITSLSLKMRLCVD